MSYLNLKTKMLIHKINYLIINRSYESNNNINSTSKRGSVVESTQQIYPVENNESSHNFHMFQYNWTQNENGSLVHPQIQNSNDNDREAYISKSNSSNEESKRPLSKKVCFLHLLKFLILQ